MKSVLGDYKRARSLVSEPNSCLSKVTHIMNMPLPCEYMGDFKSAITITLDDELGIYDVELKGVPVAYNKKTVKFADKFGDMIGVQRVIHCQVQCDFIVFIPTIDSVLEGIVNKVTSKFIGCLVHGCFYASIHHSTPMDKKLIGIKIGDAVKLRVAKLEEDGSGVLSIIGEICTIQPSRPNHTLPGDVVTYDAISNVDSGMEDILAASNGDTEPEGFDILSLESPNCGNEPVQEDTLLQTNNEYPPSLGANDFSQHNTTKEKKKKEKKKKKKDKKKHKKKMRKENDHFSTMANVGTTSLELSETVSEVGNNDNLSPSHLSSWLTSEKEMHSPVVASKPSYHETSERYTDNAFYKPPQFNEMSNSTKRLTKSSPKKGVKRKMSDQDGSSPKKRAISVDDLSKNSQQVQKEFTNHLPVITMTNDSASDGPTMKHQECNDKDGYASMSSVDDTIAWVIRHYSDQTMDDIAQMEVPTKNINSMASSENVITGHIAKNNELGHSSEKNTTKHSAKKSEQGNSLENDDPKLAGKKAKHSKHSAKKAKPSNSSESSDPKPASRNPKHSVSSESDASTHIENELESSVATEKTVVEPTSVPMSPAMDLLKQFLHQHPEAHHQLILEGWTPTKVPTCVSDSTSTLQNNANAAASRSENAQLDTSFSISQEENRTKKKKKKSKSSSKNKEKSAIQEQSILSPVPLNSTLDELSITKKKSKKKHKHKHAS